MAKKQSDKQQNEPQGSAQPQRKDQREPQREPPSLRGKKVAILATDGFEQVELTEPRKALDAAGAQSQVVSPKNGQIRGWKFTEWGEEVKVDVPLEQAKPEEFDALLLPGGVMNPDQLRMQPKAVQFVKAFFDAGKPVAAICHAPWMIIEAECAELRRIAAWPSLKTDLTNVGAEWIDEEVCVDGNLVTSRKPDDIPAFNREMLALFAKGPEQIEPVVEEIEEHPVALFVRMEAKPGREADVENLLKSGLSLVQDEPGTTSWFGMRLGDSTFGIFDTFLDDSGRQAHLSGRVARTLHERADDLFVRPPLIERIEVLGCKLP